MTAARLHGAVALAARYAWRITGEIEPTVRHLVTGNETVEHASYLEYYDEEIASTKDAMIWQAAHDTYGFKVSGIGKHEQRQGRWHLLPLWNGFGSNDNEHVWQELDDVFAGIPGQASASCSRTKRHATA
jgi:hypothetical protein